MEAIKETTELKPGDIIKNPKGKIFRIDTYHNNKFTFKIYPYPAKPNEENPSYVVVTRENLVNRKWEKLDKNNIQLPEEPELIETVRSEDDEENSLFIKEDKQRVEESYD